MKRQSLILTGTFAWLPSLLAQGPVPQQEPEVEIRGIVDPVDLSLVPVWMYLVGATVAAAILAFTFWTLYQWLGKRATPPPTAKQKAFAALRVLEREVESADPYAFSIRVSDVLRGYVTEAYGIRADAQTSPEFLEAASKSPLFSEEDRNLLNVFLEQADLIKFARVESTSANSAQLLEMARRFLEGGRE